MRGNTNTTGFKFLLLIMISILFAGPSYAAERMAVIGSEANIRSGPGTNYEVLWQVEKYHPLTVLKKKGGWYRFKDFEGDIGWIHASLIKKVSTVITKRNKCNIRSGPGQKYSIKFTAEKGIPFKVLNRNGNWIKIQHADGDIGWIYKSLVW